MSYKVLVDDNFHYQDESERYALGEFESYELAEIACRRIVDDFLRSHYREGMTDDELYNIYTSFGEDPFIVPRMDADARFSAWTYAKAQCKNICSANIDPVNSASPEGFADPVDFFSRVSGMPTPFKWALVLVVISLLSGLSSAWGQRHFVSEFSLDTIAFGIHYVSIGTSIWVGYIAGSRLNIEARFLKWVVGVVVCAITYFVWFLGTNWIPEIGWRLDAIMNAESIIEDWV